MRIAIAGGHGKIALRLAQLLHERGDQVRSLVRNPDHGDDVRQAGAEPVVCDMETASAQDVARAIEGMDALVFAAGAGPGSGAERKMTVDYGAAVKLMRAAEVDGIRRYVIVSAIGADPNKEGDEVFDAYLRAKGMADAKLEESGLDYTVVRPTGLTDDEGTGRVEVAEQVERGQVPRDDVAAVLSEVLHEPGTAGLNVAVSSGDTPVSEAVRAVAGAPPG